MRRQLPKTPFFEKSTSQAFSGVVQSRLVELIGPTASEPKGSHHDSRGVQAGQPIILWLYFCSGNEHGGEIGIVIPALIARSNSRPEDSVYDRRDGPCCDG